MTDSAGAAARRWNQADERAALVLASVARGEGPRPARLRPVVIVVASVELLLLVTAIVLPTNSMPRMAICAVVASAGLVVALAIVARSIRSRDAFGRQNVVQPLSPREQRAVKRVLRGTAHAPDDRSRVVRAAAVQTAAARGVVAFSAFVVVWSALAASGVTVWFAYLAMALVALCEFAVLVRDAALAQRFSDRSTAAAAETCATPQETDARS